MAAFKPENILGSTRKTRIGTISIVAIIIFAFYLPSFFAKQEEPGSGKNSNLIISKKIDSLKEQQQFSTANNNNENYSGLQYERSETNSFTKGEVFNFDPNTLTIEGWKRLGLNEKLIKTIINYRNKGGKFYNPEDIKKIWGMPEGFYERVKNYITITSVTRNYPRNEYPDNKNTPYEKVERKVTVVDVNSADSSALINLPGIGPKLSSRIITFRERLGGFISVSQIAETYGLPDSTFERIKNRLVVSPSDVRKININTATKDDLKVHPYIRWQLANVIVEYRNQHGVFKNLEDLKKIVLIDDVTFEKIAPYLTL